MTKLGRKKDASYRDGYLRSGAWYARRRAYLTAQVEQQGALQCACLGEELTADTADVHHVSYDGIHQDENGVWHADEADEDLLVLCRWCHERIHSLMDQDRGWSRANRRGATLRIIRTIQRGVLIAAMRLQGDGARG